MTAYNGLLLFLSLGQRIRFLFGLDMMFSIALELRSNFRNFLKLYFNIGLTVLDLKSGRYQ